MAYAHCQGGTITTIVPEIPRAWTFADGTSISGFHLHPDLWAAEGWLPIVEQRATFDPAIQQLSPPVYTINATDVTATYNAVPRPATAVNGDTVTTRLAGRLVDLQAIIDRPATDLTTNTTAAIRAAIRDLQAEVKTLARVDRIQTRKLLNLLDDVD